MNVVLPLEACNEWLDRFVASNLVIVITGSSQALGSPVSAIGPRSVWNDAEYLQVPTYLVLNEVLVDDFKQIIPINQLTRHGSLPVTRGILA